MLDADERAVLQILMETCKHAPLVDSRVKETKPLAYLRNNLDQRSVISAVGNRVWISRCGYSNRQGWMNRCEAYCDLTDDVEGIALHPELQVHSLVQLRQLRQLFRINCDTIFDVWFHGSQSSRGVQICHQPPVGSMGCTVSVGEQVLERCVRDTGRLVPRRL